jgi:hypothetical protein
VLPVEPGHRVAQQVAKPREASPLRARDPAPEVLPPPESPGILAIRWKRTVESILAASQNVDPIETTGSAGGGPLAVGCR